MKTLGKFSTMVLALGFSSCAHKPSPVSNIIPDKKMSAAELFFSQNPNLDTSTKKSYLVIEKALRSNKLPAWPLNYSEGRLSYTVFDKLPQDLSQKLLSQSAAKMGFDSIENYAKNFWLHSRGAQAKDLQCEHISTDISFIKSQDEKENVDYDSSIELLSQKKWRQLTDESSLEGKAVNGFALSVVCKAKLSQQAKTCEPSISLSIFVEKDEPHFQRMGSVSTKSYVNNNCTKAEYALTGR